MRSNSPYMWSWSLMVRPLIRVGAGDDFNPQIRVNRFVFLDFPILSLGDHLSLTDFASIPFFHGLRHPVSNNRSPPFRLLSPRSGRHGMISFSFLKLHSKHMPPRIIRDEAHCTSRPCATRYQLFTFVFSPLLQSAASTAPPSSSRWHDQHQRRALA